MHWLFCGLLLLALWGFPASASAGDIVDAGCPCGYHKKGLFLYGGRASFKTLCLFPALCATSKEITLVNVLDPSRDPRDCKAADTVRFDDPSLAPEESGEVLSYWRLSDELTLKIYAGGYVCPRCGERTLRFTRAGNWD